MIAPTIPPSIAPQPARREPPYFLVKRAASVHSSPSAIAIRMPTMTTDAHPMPPAGTSSL